MKLERQSVGVGEEGESSSRAFVEADRFDSDIVMSKPRDGRINVGHRECEMAKTAGLRV